MASDNHPSVVVVDEELPYPTNSGKRIRTYNLISRLASRYDITFLCHRNPQPGEFEEAEAHFREIGVACECVNRPMPAQSVMANDPAYYARLGMNLFSPVPFVVKKHDSRELRNAIRRIDGRKTVDLWHCEWTPYAAPFLNYSRRPWTVAAHNIESLIWQRYLEFERNAIKRMYIRLQFFKLRSFERRVFQRASHPTVVSAMDRDIAENWFGARSVAVVDNGVDVDYFRPSGSARNPYEILFLGSLDWRPNLDAVKLLLENVFPSVRERVPGARLTIVGRNPPSRLRARLRNECAVTLHHDVPDVRPYLLRAGMLVVPLRIGGGSRLKILEALATGTPVVSSKVGAEGLDLIPGEHYWQAGIEDLSQAIVRGVYNWHQLSAAADRGRQTVITRYSWDVLADRLACAWDSCIARSAA